MRPVYHSLPLWRIDFLWFFCYNIYIPAINERNGKVHIQITGVSAIGTPQTAEELYKKHDYIAAFDTLNDVLKESRLMTLGGDLRSHLLTEDEYTLLYWWVKAGVRATHQSGCSVRPALGLLSVVDVLIKSPNKRHQDLAQRANKSSLAGVKWHDLR